MGPLASVASDVFSQSYGGDLAHAVRQRGEVDPVVACYVGGAFPALLHFTYKYAASDVGVALLASANAGGENVHRGAVLGALLGTVGVERRRSAAGKSGAVNFSDPQPRSMFVSKATRRVREVTGASTRRGGEREHRRDFSYV